MNHKECKSSKRPFSLVPEPRTFIIFFPPQNQTRLLLFLINSAAIHAHLCHLCYQFIGQVIELHASQNIILSKVIQKIYR